MQRPDSEAIARMRDAVSEMREGLFAIAQDATRLHVHRPTELHSFIQAANFSLGETERELIALSLGLPSRTPSPVAAR
jgi:hypothetical protein